MPAKLACDSALSPMDVLIGFLHWCSFVLYETDDQENVETWSAGFRHRNCDKDTPFGNQIMVERGCSARLIATPFFSIHQMPHSRVATGLQIVRGHQSLWLGSCTVVVAMADV